MAVNILNADSSAQWVANTAGDTYVLKEGVYLGVLGTAISGTAAVTNRKFQIDGHVIGEGAGSGMFIGTDAVSGGFTTIHVAATGSILGEAYGIVSQGGGLELVNKGDISGSTAGLSITGDLNHVINAGTISSWNGTGLISSGIDADIVNQGTISGVTNGLELNGNAFNFVNSGLVTSSTGALTDAAVYMTGHYGQFVNEGTVSCLNSYSMLGDESTQLVTNRGFVFGAVDLGDGSDTFSNEGGTVHGSIELGAGYDTFKSVGGTVTDRVYGGAGSDFYTIDDASIELVEFFGEGTDGVKSSASYWLESNFEELYLAGKADLVGGGNSSDNYLIGNAGDNKLFGLGGNDVFRPSGGSDRFDGGAGSDLINFDSDIDSAVKVNLSTGKGGGAAAGHTFVSIENIKGSYFNDQLIGNNASNRIEGDSGNDIIAGGGGKDIFVFMGGEDADTIRDFQDKSDRIELDYHFNGFDADSFADIKGFISQKGNDAVIDFSSIFAGDKLILKNMDASDISAADFLFL
ncbi:calcium-binding protein [Rhizobium sp. LjRoot254]|uniref:calcium-binding protein n=1 Tax=Rhizobium sp. LjRoot254 TaxID=3342297 RepID=UPI003ED04A70